MHHSFFELPREPPPTTAAYEKKIKLPTVQSAPRVGTAPHKLSNWHGEGANMDRANVARVRVSGFILRTSHRDAARRQSRVLGLDFGLPRAIEAHEWYVLKQLHATQVPDDLSALLVDL